MSKPVQMSAGKDSAQVQIKADEKELFGVYSTSAQLVHSAEEFTLDFFYISPNPPVGKLVGRVIMSPGHAKRLLGALADNVRKYEAQYGEIKPPSQPEPEIGFVQ
ncbi:MAG: DUF3467 domain-containing protein [Acidobacteriota bacterium]